MAFDLQSTELNLTKSIVIFILFFLLSILQFYTAAIGFQKKTNAQVIRAKMAAHVRTISERSTAHAQPDMVVICVKQVFSLQTITNAFKQKCNN